MRMRHICVRGILSVAALLALGGGLALAASAEKGKAAFMKAGCYECHGTMGQGGITGPRIAPEPIPYETLSAFVRSSSRNMPPYREKILSEADLQDIYAYLQSIPKPPDINSIPLLKP
ncbi:MAG TPA: cytochrome c [Pseudolabrys sp.]|nr:cytochrome c [Pseudolabrys sp.]